MESIASMLADRVGDDHVGCRFEDSSITWGEIVAAGAARAHVVLALRRPGPLHVGVLLDNVPEFVYWLAGAALAGGAVVGVNPTRRGEHLARDVAHTDCQLLVTDRAHLELLDGLEVGLGPERILLVDDPTYGDVVGQHAGRSAPEVAIDAGAPYLLLFTSGSTGDPKAVICSQARLARIGRRTPKLYGITRATTTYNAMPMFHGNALMANWAGVLAMGATFSMRRRFSASGFLDDVRRFDATFANYVGRALAYILATPERPDDADNPLELVFGTEASARDRARFAERFGCEVIEGYGASEGALAIGRPDGAPPHALGRPLNGEDVIVADPATGSECPPARFDDAGALLNGDEAIGELVGRNVVDRFEGYYNNPGAMAERVRGGWYWSGDLGYRDEQGWFYFAGRSSDRLRVDGENFSAAPIEAILGRLADVVMVAVYPVADPRTGDEVMAAIELAPGANFDEAAFGDVPYLAARPRDEVGAPLRPRRRAHAAHLDEQGAQAAASARGLDHRGRRLLATGSLARLRAALGEGPRCAARRCRRARPRARGGAFRLAGRVLAGQAVDGLPQQVGMADVACVLLDHVHHVAAKRRHPAVGQRPPGRLVQPTGRDGVGDRGPRAGDGVAPVPEELVGRVVRRGAPLPIRVGLPVDGVPRRPELVAGHPPREVLVLDDGEVLQQAAERHRRAADRRVEAGGVDAGALPGEDRPLALERAEQGGRLVAGDGRIGAVGVAHQRRGCSSGPGSATVSDRGRGWG